MGTIRFLTASTLTFLLVVMVSHPVMATPNQLQERHAEQQVRQLEEQRNQLTELGAELSVEAPGPVSENELINDLVDIASHFNGFCNEFYGCGAGVRFVEW